MTSRKIWKLGFAIVWISDFHGAGGGRVVSEPILLPGSLYVTRFFPFRKETEDVSGVAIFQDVAPVDPPSAVAQAPRGFCNLSVVFLPGKFSCLSNNTLPSVFFRTPHFVSWVSCFLL